MKGVFKRLTLLAATIISVAFLLNGCSGSDGANGANGANGVNGVDGKDGVDRSLAVLDSGKLSADDLKNIALDGKIISATIPADGKPVVKFSVYNKANKQGVVGLATFSLHIAQLKPAVNGSASYWQNYISAGLPQTAMPASTNAASNPATDSVTVFNADGTIKAQGYSIVDGLDGTYTATFGADITKNTNVPYDATLVHRIAIGVRSVVVPGILGLTPKAYAGPINPTTGVVFAQFVNTNGTALVYDFTPATGTAFKDAATGSNFARDIVTIAACNQCHYRLEYGSNNTSGHFGSRPDTKVCVVCHTPQLNALSYKEGNFTSFIHKIHMGEELPAAEPAGTLAAAFGDVRYPQDIRNCTFCHKGADVDKWNSTVTRSACGSCHNNVNFATGANHGIGGVRTDDQACSLCHGSGDTIKSYHLAVRNPDPNAPELGGTNTHTYAGYLPAAGTVVPGSAVITWDVSSVSLDASSHPVIKFKFKKDGTDVVFNTYAAGAELMTNFVGSPSAYFAWAEPQDGIAKPADFTKAASAYLKNVWNGTVATSTLSAPDANGYYTLTMTGTTLPANASMFTGGIGYTYGSATPPLTQTNVALYPYTAATNVGGLIVVTPNVWKTGATFTARRTIVSNDKCNACHAKLGIAPTFHSGQRNDAPTCSFCHTVNRNNNGWSVNAKDAIHSIHAAGKRTNKFSWEASAGDTYWKIGYPGVLKNCEQCHLTGTYDFSASASAAAVPNLLSSTMSNVLIPATISTIVTGNETIPGTYYSPFVTAGADYTADNLVISPISAACFTCHDTAAAKAHMVNEGGTINGLRSVAITRTETCLVCHGGASTTNVTNTTTPAIKAVHRWW